LIFDLDHSTVGYDRELSKNQHLPDSFEDEPQELELLDHCSLGLLNQVPFFLEIKHSNKDYWG
jgi:hypothetical protein